MDLQTSFVVASAMLFCFLAGAALAVDCREAVARRNQPIDLGLGAQTYEKHRAQLRAERKASLEALR